MVVSDFHPQTPENDDSVFTRFVCCTAFVVPCSGQPQILNVAESQPVEPRAGRRLLLPRGCKPLDPRIPASRTLPAGRRRDFCYLEVAGLLTVKLGLEPMSISVRNESGRRGVRTGSIEDWELVMSRAADAEAVGSPELLGPEPPTRECMFGDFAGNSYCPAWCATKAIRLNSQSRLSLSSGSC